MLRSAVGREEGYLIRFDIDGLIGLSLLKQFDYQIRSLQGRMLVERAAE